MRSYALSGSSATPCSEAISWSGLGLGTWLGLGLGQGLGSGPVRVRANLESEDDGGLLLLTQALAVVKLAHGAAASVPDGRRLRAVHSLRQLAPG
jgi:hypothetical protein